MHRKSFYLGMGLLLLSLGSFFPGRGAQLPVPQYPLEAYKHHVSGFILLLVTFGSDGNVADCSVVHSSGSKLLDDPTVRWIKRNWHTVVFAGKINVVPITYAFPGTAVLEYPYSPAPPNTLTSTDPERKVTVKVSFGTRGSGTQVEVVTSSGSAAFDSQITDWIQSRWYEPGYAGKIEVIPFDFKPPPTKKAATSQGQAGG